MCKMLRQTTHSQTRMRPKRTPCVLNQLLYAKGKKKKNYVCYTVCRVPYDRKLEIDVKLGDFVVNLQIEINITLYVKSGVRFM